MFQAPLGRTPNPRTTAPKGVATQAYAGFREYRYKVARWPAVGAQGKFTLTVNPTNGETITIGSKTYTWQTTLTNVDGNIAIGASLAISQQNLIDAINLTGTPGTQYAAAMVEHAQVSADTVWSANALIITAKTGGVAGNSIATTDTCANGSFDAATLGTTRAGVDESDADSIAVPFSVFGMSNQSGNNLYDYFRNYWNENNGVEDLNYPPMYFPGTLRDMAASTFRKMVLPDWFGRRYVSIRKITPRLFTSYNTIASIASPFTANTGSTIIKSIPVDSSRLAILYTQNAGTTGLYLVIATINADYSLTFGTPVLVDADNAGLNSAADLCLVNTDKILLSFRQSAATNFAATRVASLSGTTITMNALVQITNVALVTSSLCKLNTDKALIAWTNGTQVSYQVVTITGTVPSYGTAATITGSPDHTNLIANGTDKAQAFYGKSSEARTVAVQISGTTVSLGSETTIQKQNNLNRYYHAAIQVATDKFVWIWTGYDRTNNGDYRNGAFITVSTLTSTVAQNIAMGNRQNNGNTEVISDIFTVTAGSEYYWMSAQGTSGSGKPFSVDTTNNLISLPKAGLTDTSSSGMGFWRTIFRDDYNNNFDFNRSERFVQNGTKMYAFYFDAYAGLMRYMAADRAVLDLSNGETLITSATLLYPGLIPAIDVNTPVMSEKAFLKIKNSNAYKIYLEVPMIYVEFE